jgi:NAD(P)H-flavin reductase
MAMLNDMAARSAFPQQLTFMYSTKVGDGSSGKSSILFLPELINIQAESRGAMSLQLFLTGRVEEDREGLYPPFQARRIDHHDLTNAIAPRESHTVCYVCGVPTMIDDFVDYFQQQGVPPTRVLCEKWW